MRTRRHLMVTFLIYLAFMVSGRPVFASVSDDPESAVPDLVIVPFANNTGQSQARLMLMPLLEKQLTERNLSLVTSAELRPLLRKNRIRTRGSISKKGARLIGAKTGTRYLLLGSWDVLKSKGNFEIGVSLRILDLDLMELTSAVSLGITGEDSVGWLDLGRCNDIEMLATALLKQAVEELFAMEDYGELRSSWQGCNQVAVIPLDNYSATEYGGDIVTNILLSRLLAKGFIVVEPGFVTELGLAREIVSRGGVDRSSAQAILDSLGACQVITGDVQRLDPQQGLPTASVPHFAAGFRAVSTKSGILDIMREIEGTGSDGDGIFQLGRVHSLTSLVTGNMNRFVEDLIKANRKGIIHGQKNR